MSAPIECAICMDQIDFNKNCVKTECGHCFHTSCLMQNVAHNGFGCPYCRSVMAEEVEDEESTEYESVDEEEEEDEEMFDSHALRGFRLFFNNLNGEEHNEEDIEEEDAAEEAERQGIVVAPSTDFVAEKLREQGVTFEQVIHMICNMDHQAYHEEEAAERFESDLFDKIALIVNNYQPAQAVVQEQSVVQEQAVVQEQHFVAGQTVVPAHTVVVRATPNTHIIYVAKPIMMHV